MNALKKAFRSPTKDNQKSSSRRREENEREEEEKVNAIQILVVSSSSPYNLVSDRTNMNSCICDNFVGFCRREESKGGYSTELAFTKPQYSTMKPQMLQEVLVRQLCRQIPVTEVAAAEQRRAYAVAIATKAAAEAAVATARAAVEVLRLTRPAILARQHNAAIAIQTAFRGYLVSAS